MLDAGHFFQQSHHLATVTKLVVVPDVQVDAVAKGCGARRVHDTSTAVANEVRRADLDARIQNGIDKT